MSFWNLWLQDVVEAEGIKRFKEEWINSQTTGA